MGNSSARPGAFRGFPVQVTGSSNHVRDTGETVPAGKLDTFPSRHTPSREYRRKPYTIIREIVYPSADSVVPSFRPCVEIDRQYEPAVVIKNLALVRSASLGQQHRSRSFLLPHSSAKQRTFLVALVNRQIHEQQSSGSHYRAGEEEGRASDAERASRIPSRISVEIEKAK